MTISAVVPDIAFPGSGGAGTSGPFSLVKSGTPLIFYSNSEVVVLRYSSATSTTPTLLVEGVDYTLTGGPDAGSITLTSPQTGLLTAERLYVTTLSALAQALDLVNGGNFSSSNLERRLDIIFQILQQQDREIKSTMRFAMFDTDEIPKTTPLGAVIDKVPYITGTTSAPTVAYLDALVLNDLSELGDANLANIAIVAADLASADTIGIVAASIGDVEDVGENIDSVVAVAEWLDGGDAGDIEVVAQGTSTTRARSLSNRHGDVINLEDTSLVFDDDQTDNATLLATLIEEAAAAGKKLYAPRPRVLWVGACAAFPEGDVTIETVPGFIIKGLAGFASPVVEIDGASYRPALNADGLHINNSLRDFVVADQSGTALSLKRMTGDIRRFFGESTDDCRDLKGDSACTMVECSDMRWWGPRAKGQPDLGFYVSGGALTASGDDYGDIEFYAPIIGNCDYALSTKRQAQRVAVYGGKVFECRLGFGTDEASTSPQVDPGRELHVAGTRFKRIGSRAINGRGPGRITGWIDIEDFGFDPDDVATPGGHTYAMRLLGNSNCDIKASVRQRDWSGAGLNAMTLGSLTLDSGTYIAKKNRVVLTVEGLANGIVEGTGVTANNYDLMTDTVTTPVTLASGSASKFKVQNVNGVEYGTNWMVLKNTGAAASHTGDTAETVKFTVTVPGGYMGPNGRIRVKGTVTHTNSANNKIIRVRLGGLAGTSFAQITDTTVAANTFEFDITNTNSATAQVGGVTSGQGGWSTSSASTTGTVTTTSDQDLVITVQLANSGETIALTNVCAEILYGA